MRPSAASRRSDPISRRCDWEMNERAGSPSASGSASAERVVIGGAYLHGTRGASNPYAQPMPTPSKAVLITGCSTGIGHATAKRLAGSGWKVYASARRLESIADLRQAGCETLALDVTDEASMSTAVAAVEQAEGAVGVLINNAGYSQSGAIETVPMDSVRRQFETNVFGVVRTDTAGAAEDARAGLGKDRQRRLDGRPSHLPGRRALPRHQVRPGGALRRAALRAAGLRHRRGAARAGADHDRVRQTPRPPAWPTSHPLREDPYAHFNATVGAVTKGAYDGPMRHFGAGPDRVAKVIERAIARRRPPARVRITALGQGDDRPAPPDERPRLGLLDAPSVPLPEVAHAGRRARCG